MDAADVFITEKCIDLPIEDISGVEEDCQDFNLLHAHSLSRTPSLLKQRIISFLRKLLV